MLESNDRMTGSWPLDGSVNALHVPSSAPCTV